jgi:hypothetical protein
MNSLTDVYVKTLFETNDHKTKKEEERKGFGPSPMISFMQFAQPRLSWIGL